MKIKILLLGSESDCQRLRIYLKDDEIAVVGIVSDENLALEEISKTAPDLILVTSISPMSLRACQQIYLLRPRSVPVVLTQENNLDALQKIIETGVHYILPAQMEPTALINELKGIYTNESNRILSLENASAAPSKSRVILVFGTKGGIGKSTIAVNLAVKLVQRQNRVVILDYSFQFGCVGTMLGLSNRSTISELVQEQVNPNADLTRQFLAVHSSGVSALLAPNSPEDGAAITAGQAEQIISVLRVYYDYIIIDTSPVINDITTVCFDCASVILFVTRCDIASIRNAKKGLVIVEALADSEKIKLVVCDDLNGQIKEGDIARVLSTPVWQVLPNDYKAAIDAVNLGKPVVQSYPMSKLSKGFEQLALKIDGGTLVGSKGARKDLWIHRYKRR